MSERKVLNKYFPPDFDPSKIPRRKIAKDAQQTVRLMAPCTLCCLTCGEFIYKGKKFNAKKETAIGEEYYGIKIFRFYIKCTRCSAEITFKTDPKNADYIVELGATRNFEPWRDSTTAAMPNASADDEDHQASDEEPEDAMDALEESQRASKQQMEDEDELADLRQRNARVARSDLDPEAILAQHHAISAADAERQRKEDEEDDAIIKGVFYKVAKNPPAAPAAAVVGKVDKGKGRAMDQGLGMGGYGSGSDSDEVGEGEGGEVEEKPVETVTVKRTLANTLDRQPTVEELLRAKGVSGVVPVFKKPGLPASAMGKVGAGAGMKRKDLASSLGIKVVKKKKVV